ncbi:SgcJ/EcaC family oxidoreductase [Gloeocapsopsis crepidinum LEGE 06123]|uniref:SgcJ/EcaC family oxidoreductase n=1 Tax=Gloeocapsopsis crepidinum LEGE 06123 TaxID=588587 RepID=A0ABR9UW39_9CHRO|nr:SgcJ/EcaC family oxidoreductase [Gloeocapsopsis crepidinum]MBE9191800.1 SgcJ/EcaC family oxidoreductase [Gloeocapsopsis crepidinum LEGE 06123]
MNEYSTQASQSLTSNPVDEAAICALFEQLVNSWNQGAGDAYGELFEEDADYVAFDGSHTKGRAAIAIQHQQLFDTFLRGTRLKGQIDSMQFLSPDVALIHTTGGTLMSWQSDASIPGRKSIQTLVARKRDGKWYFVAFHNTRIRPMDIETIASGMTNLLWQKLRPSR